MKKLSVFLALTVLLASPGYGSSVEVTWAWPTQRVGGAPLALSELKELQAAYGPCNADKTAVASVTGGFSSPPPATTTVFSIDPGEYCLQAWVLDMDLLESDKVLLTLTVRSGSPPLAPEPISFRLLPDPTPPQTLETYSAGGYQSTAVQRVVDGIKVKAPGSNTVKVGVPCDCSLYNIVDAAQVRWCSVGGQLQTAFNTADGGIRRGEPFPANYVATCREKQP